jgi:hypothetical protein
MMAEYWIALPAAAPLRGEDDNPVVAYGLLFGAIFAAAVMAVRKIRRNRRGE